ncbi:MAG: hypothetical protein R3C41_20405 [Calditrichia bacterium]
MIRQFFLQVIEQKGTEAIGIFSHDGKMLDSWLASGSSDNVLKDLGETFLHIYSVLSRPDMADLKEIQISFDKGMVFARASERFYLLVIQRHNANPNLIRMAANCGIHELENHRKGQRMIRKLPEQSLSKKHFNELDEVEKIMLDHIMR